MNVHVRNTINVNTTEPVSEATLDVVIAREVAEATNGFDPREIQRLKALISAPMLEGALGSRPDVLSETMT